MLVELLDSLGDRDPIEDVFGSVSASCSESIDNKLIVDLIGHSLSDHSVLAAPQPRQVLLVPCSDVGLQVSEGPSFTRDPLRRLGPTGVPDLCRRAVLLLLAEGREPLLELLLYVLHRLLLWCCIYLVQCFCDGTLALLSTLV